MTVLELMEKVKGIIDSPALSEEEQRKYLLKLYEDVAKQGRMPSPSVFND